MHSAQGQADSGNIINHRSELFDWIIPSIKSNSCQN